MHKCEMGRQGHSRHFWNMHKQSIQARSLCNSPAHTEMWAGPERLCRGGTIDKSTNFDDVLSVEGYKERESVSGRA